MDLKKAFAVLYFLFATAVVSWAVSTTTNLSLNKPASGESGWDAYLNSNADILDGLFDGVPFGLSGGNTGVGTATPDGIFHVSGDAGLGAGVAYFSANTGTYAEAISVPADIEAAIVTKATFRADANSHSAGIYSVIPSGGHADHSAAGIFERIAEGTRLYLGGSDEAPSITGPYLHAWDETNSETDFVIRDTGTVGIATITPSALLDVDGRTGRGIIEIDGDTGGCLKINDTDNGGFTYCTALNGVLSCSSSAC